MRGNLKISKRIRAKGVSPDLGNDNVRVEGRYKRVCNFIEGFHINGIISVRQQRYIDGITFAPSFSYFILKTGTGIKINPTLVERYCQHLVRLIIRLLDTITVVGINIQIEYPSSTGNQPVDCNHRIIQVRKTGSPSAVSMMPATVHIEGDIEPLLLYQPHSLEGRSGAKRGIIKQSLENRAICVAQAKPEIGPWLFRNAEFLETGNVIWGMK